MPNNENRVREGTTCFHAGKNLFSKQNAQLLANPNVITGISKIKSEVIIKEEISDDGGAEPNAGADADADALDALANELRGKTDFTEADAHETSQVANLLTARLQKDLGCTDKGSPKVLSKKSTIKVHSIRGINIDKLTNKPLPVGGKKLINCKHCDKVFRKPCLLARHITAHTGERRFECQYCARGFTTQSNRLRHERAHTRNWPYLCEFCGMSFATSATLKRHYHTCHSKVLSKKSTIKVHSIRGINIDKLTNKPLPVGVKKLINCKHCDKVFRKPCLLARHITAHTGERRFECQYCARGFTTQSNKLRHERAHTRNWPYLCEFCGMSFATSATLKRHYHTCHSKRNA